MPQQVAAPRSANGGAVSHIGNKQKREDVYRKHKKGKAQEKLRKRIERAKEEKGEDGKEKKKVSNQHHRARC